ncbi:MULTISPECIES: SDR family oxidoreductase [unclassified Microbacterium]|uniref:SDR family oxidoreductase n=1 Tax=unclassified Microbacterium TaxID=2609290 RepID=UPI00177FA25B|nr:MULTISPECIES: NmrA family NAD(P)-binding protein [unclassified Microbacterium]MBD8207894.1 NmrA family NAD(P)-binding protein [Microbacterium sp. CFBP 8801]MBD8477184.1 NmrA family NAD(P)-binding protein [Microbacterium sp. CFBP 8794]MBD8511054.1 NmrA family NAD(P)-binding protein [Microbacterium sp. CFBP 8790]
MTLIIHGATGAQGAPILPLLLAAGFDAVAAVRDTTKADVKAVTVDFNSVASLAKAYQDADGVFVHLPLGSPDQQAAFATAIGDAVAQSRPKRVVFSTSGYPLTLPDGAITAHGILHNRLRESGVSYAVIAPKTFLENLLLPVTLGPVRVEGSLRYPIREDYAISWVSHLDMADIAVKLLTDNRDVQGVVEAGALPALLGDDLADAFSAHLNEPVTFISQNPDDYGKLITPIFGAAGVEPVVASYHARWSMPDERIDESRSAQTLLGITPRSVEQWLRDRGI